MKKIHILLLLAFMDSSCQNSFKLDLLECDYNAVIAFNYNIENSTVRNAIPEYLNTLTVYVFNKQGDLVTTGEADEAFEYKLMLNPGQYSVIAIGNMGNKSVIEETTKANLLLKLSDVSFIDGYAQQSERLYYTYRAFSVLPNTMSRVRADVVHAHCLINYTIKWETPPTDQFNSYFIQLRDLPSQYSLVPQFAFPNMNQWVLYDSSLHDYYTGRNQDVIHYLPAVLTDRNIVTYRNQVSKTAGSIMGQTISYRLREAGHTFFALYGRAADGTQTQLMNEVNINKFLTNFGADLDHTLRQEYEVLFTIKPDGRVLVTLVGVGEWDEGEW